MTAPGLIGGERESRHLAGLPDPGHSLTIDSGWRTVADECPGWPRNQGL
jgi:hypothetical protein